MPIYEQKLDNHLRRLQQSLPHPIPELEGKGIRDIIQVPSVEQILAPARAAVGSFVSLLASVFVVILYLVFLAAEVFSFPDRACRALGEKEGGRLMSIMGSINQAVGGYLAVLTLINASIGLLSFAVLMAFDVPFAALWGLLMFLFAYIPYIGSIVVTLAVLLLCVIRFEDRLWMVLVVGSLLVGIQQVLGAYLQPKLLGNRLGVSPLLILLSLGFWGLVWGVIGMILAVPLLMVVEDYPGEHYRDEADRDPDVQPVTPRKVGGPARHSLDFTPHRVYY